MTLQCVYQYRRLLISVILTAVIGLSIPAAAQDPAPAAPGLSERLLGSDQPTPSRFTGQRLGPGVRPFWTDGTSSYRIDSAAGNAETRIIADICIGERLTIPVGGRMDNERLLPAQAAGEAADATLARNGARLTLEVGASDSGEHRLKLKNSSGGQVRGLTVIIRARHCGKKAAGPDIFGAGAGSAQKNGRAVPGRVGSAVKEGAGAVSAAGSAHDPSATGESGDDAVESALDDAEKAAEEAAARARRAGDRDSAAARRSARNTADETAGRARDSVEEAANKSKEAAEPARGKEPAGAEQDDQEEAPLKDHPYAQPAPRGAAFSSVIRNELQSGTRLVQFTSVDSDLGGRTRVDSRATGEIRSVSFLAVDGEILDRHQSGAAVREADGDIIIDVPARRGIGAILLETANASYLLLSGTAQPGGAAAAAVLDGVLEVEQGALAETLEVPRDAIDADRPVAEHHVQIAGTEARIIALHDRQLAVEAENISLPPDGRAEIVVTGPANEKFSATVHGWGYNLQVPPVMQRGATVDITAVLSGVPETDSVLIEMFAQEGQQITPPSVLVEGGRNGEALAIATLSTEMLGPQSFGVSASRSELLSSTGTQTQDDPDEAFEFQD